MSDRPDGSVRTGSRSGETAGGSAAETPVDGSAPAPTDTGTHAIPGAGKQSGSAAAAQPATGTQVAQPATGAQVAQPATGAQPAAGAGTQAVPTTGTQAIPTTGTQQAARAAGARTASSPAGPARGSSSSAPSAPSAPAASAPAAPPVPPAGAPTGPATGAQRAPGVPPVQPAGAGAPGATGTSTTGPAKGKTGRTTARGPRRARLQLRHIDTWSALKISLVLSIALFFIWMVAVGVLYGVLNALGVFDTLNELFGQLGTDSGSEGSSEVLTPGVVFGGAAVIGAINVVLLTALCTVGTFIYNMCSDLVGGLELTLSERD